MLIEVSLKLLKVHDDMGYNRAFKSAFTDFPKDVGFNDGLSTPRPDFVEGLEKEEFHPLPIDQINGAILYTDGSSSLELPHLAGVWKGNGKDMEEARLQSAYDGAALVYARNQALSYLGRSDPPGHAEVTTFTTDGTNLNLYAHYAAPSEDGTLKYHQYPIASANLLKDRQEYSEGRRGLRNEQDHARKESYALRDQLKEHWKKRRRMVAPQSIAEGPLPINDGTFGETITYEDEGGYKIVEQPCQPTPAASSTPRKTSSSFSSKSVPPANGYVPDSSGQKQKASSSSSRYS